MVSYHEFFLWIKENLCFLLWTLIINKKESLVSYLEFLLRISKNLWSLTMNQKRIYDFLDESRRISGFLLWIEENL